MPPPASSSDEDPIGSGGFITPPAPNSNSPSERVQKRNMNQLRVLSLTTLMLMLASRVPAQTAENWDGQVVACNHGTITFSVAQAYRDSKPFSGYQWQFEGWYNVEPGKCTEIGSPAHYHNGGSFSGKDSVTLLAFAFYDSTGTWGSPSFRIPETSYFILPISSFAFNVRDFTLTGIRRRAISRERATGRRRGIR